MYFSVNRRCIIRAFSSWGTSSFWMAWILRRRSPMPSSSGRGPGGTPAVSGDVGEVGVVWRALVGGVTGSDGLPGWDGTTRDVGPGGGGKKEVLVCKSCGVSLTSSVGGSSRSAIDGRTEGPAEEARRRCCGRAGRSTSMAGASLEANPAEKRRAWRRTGVIRNSETSCAIARKLAVCLGGRCRLEVEEHRCGRRRGALRRMCCLRDACFLGRRIQFGGFGFDRVDHFIPSSIPWKSLADNDDW